MKRASLLFSSILLTAVSFAQVPAGWITDEVHPGNDVRLYQDDALFTEGTKSCHLQLNSGAVPYLISENFPVTPGKSYHFSIDVLDNDTTGQLKIYCDFYDAVGNNVLGEDPVFSSDSPEWKTIQWSGTVPPDAAEGYVLVKFYCQPELTTFRDTANIWVDNCNFVPEGGANVIINGGFEEWPVGIEEPQTAKEAFSFYPNPAKDIIHLTTVEQADRIQVCDLSGKILMEKSMVSRDADIDIGHLGQGLYIISIVKGSSIIGSRKLIRN